MATEEKERDTIYDAYKENNSYVKYVEIPSYKAALGDVTGLQVLDLGCGSGFWTRKIVKMGAEHVVGIDISKTFIDIAKERMGDREEYHLRDAANQGIGLGELKFDVIFCNGMLAYLPSLQHILSTVKDVYSYLKPGGRFITTHPICDNSVDYTEMVKYGLFYEQPSSPNWEEGHPWSYFVESDAKNKEKAKVDVLWVSPDFYKRALREAGFKDASVNCIIKYFNAGDEDLHPDGYWNNLTNKYKIIKAVRN